MKEDTALLVHGVLIDPIEDSTSDNLNGLAELLDLCRAADLTPRLGMAPASAARPATVLALDASGPVDEVASVARQAAALAIYPDVGVKTVSAAARANELLEGTVGVLVQPVELLPTLIDATKAPTDSEGTSQ